MTITVSPLQNRIKAYVLEFNQQGTVAFIDSTKFMRIVRDRTTKIEGQNFRALKRVWNGGSFEGKKKVALSDKEWVVISARYLDVEPAKLHSKLRELAPSVVL